MILMNLKEILLVGLAIVFLALALIAVPFAWERWYSARCTTDIVESQMALAESHKNLADSTERSGSPRCIAYHHHIQVLKRAAAVTALCGSPQMTPYATWVIPEAEEAFYRRLVAEQCR